VWDEVEIASETGNVQELVVESADIVIRVARVGDAFAAAAASEERAARSQRAPPFF